MYVSTENEAPRSINGSMCCVAIFQPCKSLNPLQIAREWALNWISQTLSLIFLQTKLPHSPLHTTHPPSDNTSVSECRHRMVHVQLTYWLNKGFSKEDKKWNRTCTPQVLQGVAALSDRSRSMKYGGLTLARVEGASWGLDSGMSCLKQHKCEKFNWINEL